MNLPNKLTILRIIMTPVFLLFAAPVPPFLVEQTVFPAFSGAMRAFDSFIGGAGGWIAGVIFVLAFITDMLDGQIARKYNLVTNFGKFLDPIADKLLVTAAMIALVERRELSAWIAVIIISREFIVTGIRLLAVDRGVVIAAGNLGKLKTVMQMIALTLMLFHNFSIHFLSLIHIDDICMFAALVLTIVSGVDYLVKNKHLLNET